MEDINSSSNQTDIVNIPFKFFSEDFRIETNVLNGLTFYYDINLSQNIHEFLRNIYYNIKSDFGISTFELVPCQLGEFGLDLKQYLMTQYDNYDENIINIGKIITNQSAFYVRPISITNEDLDSLKKIYERLIQRQACQLCFTRGYPQSRYFTCMHEICAHCYTNLNNRLLTGELEILSCSICR